MKSQEIAAFRRKHYGSQAAMAKAIGVTQAAVAQWESGKRVPSAPVLLLLSHLRREKKLSKSR